MARYCPICGKSDQELAFFGELCEKCAKTRLAPFPPVKLILCQKCGHLIDKGRNRKDAFLREEVVRLLKLKGKNASFDEEKSEIEYDAAGGRIKQPVLILYEKSICLDCGRAGSQYFEAIIQLRGNKRRVQKVADRLVLRLERRTFVPKIEELKEGSDVYCGSRSEAIAALNAQGLGFVRTEKLAGQREGKRLYRTTLLVRL